MGCVGEAFLAYAVIGGLAVLQAFAAGDIRECEEEVVDVVVARGVGRSSFADEVCELGKERGAGLGVFGGIGYDIDVVFGSNFGGEGELVEVLAGDDGGVFELLYCSRGVADHMNIVSVLADAPKIWPQLCKGGADAPAG